ncbi:hypothetical protein SAMN04487957_10593 [Halomonas shengliensis]|uniref:Tape measure domain-containing protein n=1 Tax=Halomonas shengliensis TaxID=419597 RepID=A0A1H0IEY7_9GAMM|nr:hypothetical protein [Halomonas shengliensis]SDO29896.1 hypothetical protein SAMN04487957_10593 [Halomonas shengliensis]
MATNPNDIQLRITAAVDGLKDIGALLSEIDELGGDTTAASADVEKLNEAMSSLGQQRKLIDSLEQTRGKVSEAEQAMGEAVGEAERLRRAYDDSAQGVDAQRRAAQAAAEQADTASQAYREQQRALKALQTQYKGVQQSTTGARQAWRDAAERVKDLERAIEASGEATTEQARQLDEARGAADQARRSYEQQAQSLSGIRDELQDQRQSVDQAKQSWEDYRDESRDLNRDLKESERAFARQGKELNRAEQAADKARTSFERQGRALTELGEDAKSAGIDVDNLADEQQRLDRESEDLERSVVGLKRSLRDYRNEVGRTEGGVRQLGRRLAQGVKRFGAWTIAAGAAAAALAVERITRYTNAQAELAQQVQNTADAIGVNAQVLQEFQYAFERLGLGADKAGDLLKDVADKIGDAYVNGGGEAKDAIDALGLSIEQLVNLSPDQQLLAIASALSQLPKAGQVNVLESLANDASLLQPLLDNNAEALRRLAREANEVGAIMTPEQIADLVETESAIGRITGRLRGLKNQLTASVAPSLTRVAEAFDELLEDKPRIIDDIVRAFAGVTKASADWATAFLKHKDVIQGGVTVLIGTANLLWQTFRTVGNSIMALGGTIVTAFLGFMGGVTETVRQATELLNRFGLVSDETMALVREQSAATVNAMKTMFRFTKDSAAGALDAIETIGKGQLGVLGDAEASAEGQVAAHGRIAQSAIEASMQVSGLADAYSGIADSADESVKRALSGQKELDLVARNMAVIIGSVGNEYDRLAEAAEGVGMSMQELKTGISEAEASMIASFATLVEKGDFTKEQLNRAMSEVFSQLGPEARDKLRSVVEAMRDAGNESAKALYEPLLEMFAKLEEDAEGAAESVSEISDKADQAAEDLQGLGQAALEGTEQASNATWSLAQVLVERLEYFKTKLGEYSTAAKNMFLALRGYDVQPDGLEAMTENLAKAREELTKLRLAMVGRGVDSTKFLKLSYEMAIQAKQVEIAFLNQRVAAEKLFERLQAGNATISDLNLSAEELKERFDLLDETTLNQLEGALNRIRSQVESLRGSLEGTVSSLQQELARLEGDNAKVQELRYLEQEEELQARLQQARELGDKQAIMDARQALELAEKIHRQKMQTIREESQAPGATAGIAQPTIASPAQQVAQPTRAVRITLETGQGTAQLTADSDRDEQLLLDALGRDARRTTH